MLYHWFEMSHAALAPSRAAVKSCRMMFNHPFNPVAYTNTGRNAAAACQLFERVTRRYTKPSFGIGETTVDGVKVKVNQKTVWRKPFCRLLHFERELPAKKIAGSPRVLLVAPMSGHYATLLRGTVQKMLPDFEVYITDWTDARMVPFTSGKFDLDDYIDYLIEMLKLFDGDVHAVAVCQPSVPLLAAVSLLEAENAPYVPASMTLMGGPVDTRKNPTAVNKLAHDKGTEWFRRNVLSRVPWPHPGVGRKVYPGFLQLTGFMTMNLDRHIDSHNELFRHLVQGDGESANKHKDFYNEYLAVMDLTADYYLQTVDTVFVRHALPNGEMMWRGRPVDPSAIRRVPLMTIEGELDDITGLGQCAAAHDLCTGLPENMQNHYEQPGVGHYGVFNGSRFREHIYPRMKKFFYEYDRIDKPVKKQPARRKTELVPA